MVSDMEKNIDQAGGTHSPFFSIIVPVYNAEKYIRRCTESIKRQNYEDYEVIFIDDSSQDSSSNICAEIVQRDRRFKYFKKPHAGAAAARNYGIAEAAGRYIVFVDVDDYIAEQFLEKLRESISDKGLPDICFLNSHYEVDKNKIGKNVVFHIPETADLSEGLPLKEFADLVTQGTNQLPGSTWLAVMKRGFLGKNQLQFDENLIWSEDSDFIYRALTRAEKITCCSYCGYYYDMDNSQSVSKKFSLKKAMGRMDVYSRWALYFKENAEAEKKFSGRARAALTQQMLSEYCEFLNICMEMESERDRKYLRIRLKKERGLWKQCRNYKYKDYVKYGIELGTLIQKLKRWLKYFLKLKQ